MNPNEEPVATETPKEFENGLLKVNIGNDSYALLHELNGLESMKADGLMSGAINVYLVAKMYALFSVSKLFRNGVEVTDLPPVKDAAQVWARSTKFTGRELLKIMDAYASEYMSDPTTGEEQLKKESLQGTE